QDGPVVEDRRVPRHQVARGRRQAILQRGHRGRGGTDGQAGQRREGLLGQGRRGPEGDDQDASKAPHEGPPGWTSSSTPASKSASEETARAGPDRTAAEGVSGKTSRPYRASSPTRR